MPTQYDMTVWKGNTFSLPIRLKTRDGATVSPMDMTGSTLVFRVVWAGGSMRKATGDAGFSMTNAAQGEALLSLTAEETRLIPAGSRARYEIERRIGAEQTTLMYGVIKASEWANDDA